MAKTKKTDEKTKTEARVRYVALPPDLDAWVERELEDQQGMSFNVYIKLILADLRARQERGYPDKIVGGKKGGGQ